MTRAALADRIINYSDALAAFSLVNALAFVITLADPDIRCSIASIAATVILANLAVPISITAGLMGLRRLELSLRRTEEEDPEVVRFWRYAQLVRLALVWIVALGLIVGVGAATHDPSCESSEQVSLDV
jgi:hypothetical protein